MAIPGRVRAVLGAAGRAIAFVLLFVLLDVAFTMVLTGPLTSIVTRLGQHVRIDEIVSVFAALAATAIMLRKLDRRSWHDVGLSRADAAPRPIAEGGVLGTAAIAPGCGVLLLVGWLRILAAPDGSSLGAAARISVVLVPAALAEELLCRGYLLTVARDAIGAAGAMVLTSLAFGLLHASNPGATVETVALVTLAGIFLAAVRLVVGSLYAAWSAHLAWNFMLAVPLHAPVSGLRFESPDYRTVSAGPEWATGGAWGPEGGLAAGLGMLAGLGYLYARRRREES